MYINIYLYTVMKQKLQHVKRHELQASAGNGDFAVCEALGRRRVGLPTLSPEKEQGNVSSGLERYRGSGERRVHLGGNTEPHDPSRAQPNDNETLQNVLLSRETS